MRVFLSYAGEYRNIADSIAIGLQQDGHKVFFDRDTLPPGEGFDSRIRQAVAESDVMVFLIGPEAVSRGAYTLTELGFARERWKDPSSRVLPVMAAKTPFADIPPYLRSVTVLEPEGNVVAEVCAAVAKMARGRGRRWGRVAVPAGIVVGAGIVLAAILVTNHSNHSETCFLASEIQLQGQRAASHAGMTLDITGGGATHSFILSEQGSGPIQIPPEQLENWSVELRDTEGGSLGTAQFSGCPATPQEVVLNEGIVLTLRSR